MKNIKVLKHKNITWYKVFKPEKKGLKKLQGKFNFHPLDIEDCLEKKQRPKLDIYNNYIFMVLHLPYWSEKSPSLETAELKVFIARNFLITLNENKIPVLDELFYLAKTNGKKRARFFKKSSFHLFYFLFNQLLLDIKPLIKEVGRLIDEIDKQVLSRQYKEVFKQISVMRRNLIVFQTIIKPQIPLFRKLEEGKAKEATKGVYPYYWGNLVDRLRSVWEQLEDYMQILEGLATTNESLLTYKTNEIIKILTIFSVVLLPLTLISGIYGMNIRTLPFLFSPFSFIFISGVMLGIVVLMLLFFKTKKWV